MPDIDQQLQGIANLIGELPDADISKDIEDLEASIKAETKALKDDAESNKKFNKIQIAKEVIMFNSEMKANKATRKAQKEQQDINTKQVKHNAGAKAARTVMLEQNQKILQILQRGGIGGGTGGGGAGGGGGGTGGGTTSGGGSSSTALVDLASVAKQATGIIGATKNASKRRVSQGRSTLASNIFADRGDGKITEALQGDETNTKNLKELGAALKEGDQKAALTKIAKLRKTASPELAESLGLDQVEQDVKGTYGDRVKGAIKGSIFGVEQGTDLFSKEGLKQMFSMENIMGKADSGGLTKFAPFKETSSANRAGRLEAEQEAINQGLDYLTPELSTEKKDYAQKMREQYGVDTPTAAGTGPAPAQSKREKIVASRTGIAADKDKLATEETLKEVLEVLKEGGGVGAGGGGGGPGVVEGLMGGALATKGKALLGKAKSAGGKLLRGGARLAAGAARFAGPAAAVASAGYGLFKGGQQAFTREGLSEFNLEEGEDATLGQKLASGAGGLISGLSFGMLGGDDGNDLSKSLYEFFGGEIKEKVKEQVVDEVVAPVVEAKKTQSDKPALKQTDQEMLDKLRSTSIAEVDQGEAFKLQSDEEYREKNPLKESEPFKMKSDEEYRALNPRAESEPFMLMSDEEYQEAKGGAKVQKNEGGLVSTDEALQEIEVTAKKKPLTPEQGEQKMKDLMEAGATPTEAVDTVSQELGGTHAKANEMLDMSAGDLAAQAMKNAKSGRGPTAKTGTGTGTAKPAKPKRSGIPDSAAEDAAFKKLKDVDKRIAAKEEESAALGELGDPALNDSWRATDDPMAAKDAWMAKKSKVEKELRALRKERKGIFDEIDKAQGNDGSLDAFAEKASADFDKFEEEASAGFDEAMEGASADFDVDQPMKGTGNAEVVTKTEKTVTGGGSTSYRAAETFDNETSKALMAEADAMQAEEDKKAAAAAAKEGGSIFDYLDTEESQLRNIEISKKRSEAHQAKSFIPHGEIDYDAEGNEIGRRGFGELVNPGDPGHHYKGSLEPSVLDTGNAVGNMTRLSQEASAAAAAPIVVPAPAPAPAPSSDTPKIVGVTVEPGVRLAKDSAQLRAQDRRTIG